MHSVLTTYISWVRPSIWLTSCVETYCRNEFAQYMSLHVVNSFLYWTKIITTAQNQLSRSDIDASMDLAACSWGGALLETFLTYPWAAFFLPESWLELCLTISSVGTDFGFLAPQLKLCTHIFVVWSYRIEIIYWFAPVKSCVWKTFCNLHLFLE